MNGETINDLTFVRLRFPRAIPVDLIESVKGRTFTPEQFYAYQESQEGNPYNYLYALVDKEKKIHGYLWAEVNILDNSLFVNTFSVDKKYWGKGEAIPVAVEFLKKLRCKERCPKVFWLTTNEKFFLKYGFKRSKNVLMEFDESKEEVTHGTV